MFLTLPLFYILNIDLEFILKENYLKGPWHCCGTCKELPCGSHVLVVNPAALPAYQDGDLMYPGACSKLRGCEVGMSRTQAGLCVHSCPVLQSLPK